MVKVLQNINGVKDAVQIIRKILDTSKGLEGQIKQMNIIKACNGYCLTEWKVEEAFTNPFGTLHGGMAATLIDQVTSMAANSHEKINWRKNVALNMYIQYMGKADIGDLLKIEANTISVRNTMAIVDAVIENLTTGKLVAKGMNVKYILPEKDPDEKLKNAFLPETRTK